jgi:hypothetical protein
VTDARGLSLAEILVAVCVLAVGLTAAATGLRYAAAGVDLGHGETTATFLADARLERLRGLALAEWGHPLLAAGTSREEYGTIAGAPRFRRETTVWDRGGAGCADPSPPTVTCKTVRVAVSWRPASGGERRVELATVLAPRR